MPTRRNQKRPKAIFLGLLIASLLSVISISMIDATLNKKYTVRDSIELEDEKAKTWKYHNFQVTLSKIIRIHR